MTSTVFSKIVDGSLSCYKIFEDDKTIAFLDINPLTKGHTLVIPKESIDHIDECSPELYSEIFDTVRKVSLLLKSTFNPKRIGVVVHGFEVPHAHVHVVPLYTGDEIQLAGKSREAVTGDELLRVMEEITEKML